MLFQFAPAIQAGIDAGKYLQVFSNKVPLSMARDTVTGQFVVMLLVLLLTTALYLH